MYMCIYSRYNISFCSWNIERKLYARAILLWPFFLLVPEVDEWKWFLPHIFWASVLMLQMFSLLLSAQPCILQICLWGAHWCFYRSNGKILESDDLSFSSQVKNMFSPLRIKHKYFHVTVDELGSWMLVFHCHVSFRIAVLDLLSCRHLHFYA